MSDDLDSSGPPSKRQRLDPTRVTIGIDTGTSGFRASLTCDDATKNIPMGYRSDPDGKRKPYFSFSTAFLFEPDGLKLAGHRTLNHFGDEHYGLKESLDDRLCKGDGPGSSFRDFCANSGTTPWAAFRMLLEDRWLHINNQVKEMLGDEPFEIVNVTFTVPASQASDDIVEGETHGRDIQAKMRQYAIEAGIPENIIDTPRTEPEAIASHLAALEAKMRKDGYAEDTPRIDVVFDMGAGTTDVTVYFSFQGRAILLRDSCTAEVGMGALWHKWHQICKSWTTDEKQQNDVCRDLRFHVHESPVGCEDFTRSGGTILAHQFQSNLNKCCDRALRLLETELNAIDGTMIDKVRTLRLHGAVLSNLHVRSYLEGKLKDIRTRMRAGGFQANFDWKILESEEHDNAVARGASMPFSKDPVPGFRRAVVGVLCKLPVLSDALRPEIVVGATQRNVIIELKAANTLKLESQYEGIIIDTEPNDFWVELHELIFVDQPLGEWSGDTGRPYWPEDYAMPMGPVKFDLTRFRAKGDKVWVRLVHKMNTLYVLEVACCDDRDAKLIGPILQRQLRLCKDGEREFWEVDEGKTGATSQGTRSGRLNSTHGNDSFNASARYSLRSKESAASVPAAEGVDTTLNEPETPKKLEGTGCGHKTPISRRSARLNPFSVANTPQHVEGPNNRQAGEGLGGEVRKNSPKVVAASGTGNTGHSARVDEAGKLKLQLAQENTGHKQHATAQPGAYEFKDSDLDVPALKPLDGQGSTGQAGLVKQRAASAPAPTVASAAAAADPTVLISNVIELEAAAVTENGQQ